jgi:hypothetical protein
MLKSIMGLSIIGFLSGCVTVTPDSDNTPPFKTKMASNGKMFPAEGQITVTTTSNHNNMVEMVVKNMGRPSKVIPSAKTFIVWETPTGSNLKPQSLGPLNLDKNFNGKIKTVTPFRNFDIFITAEPKANQITPTGERLLWTNVSR